MTRNTDSSRKSLVRILIAVVLLAISAGFVAYHRVNPRLKEELYETKVVPPTCTDSGYTLYTNKENGSTYTDDLIPATGHSFAPWQEDISDPMVIRSIRICETCGYTESEISYPDLSVPVLGLEGSLDGIGKKSEVNVTVSFSGTDESFISFATLKYQGHSSLSYEKKNYTLKFFTDENRSQKWKRTFGHWNPENKYILKANYIDPSQCRNLVSADIWADVVACRDNLRPQLKGLSNFGAVDGFPVALYINGSFQGLYTMNLHKDDDLFGMKDGLEHAILIANTDTGDEAFFRSVAAFLEDTPWEVEFCGTEDNTWAKEKLNELITFVMESDDETFRQELDRYLDVDSAIDYLLSIYALGLTRHGADELMLVCYDSRAPWVCSLYDMETAFGLSADGTATLNPEEFLPERAGDIWNSATGSLLWDRLLQNFFPEIQQRYQALRQTVFEPQLMCDRVSAMIGSIDPILYSADNDVYPHPNPQINHQEQIAQYIHWRIALLDEILMAKTGA